MVDSENKCIKNEVKELGSSMDEHPRFLTNDGYETLYSKKYAQTYHSIHGVLREAHHVFIDGCGIDRLLSRQQELSILEVGFGTGFNFLLSASRALEKGRGLHYTALENDLLPAALLRKLNHHRLPHIRSLRMQMLACLEKKQTEGPITLLFDAGISLKVILGDAVQAELGPDTFDAIYLDAFSPTTNPELWQGAFLQKLHRSLRKGGVLATYSCKGTVRRALRDVGFKVYKHPGPPGKREVLHAIK